MSDAVLSPIAVWPLIACTFVVALFANVLSARFAKALTLADTPNDRSSHNQPISRAGGVAIVLAWSVGLFALLMLGVFSQLDVGRALMVLVLSLSAAAFGIADDRSNLSPLTKFVGQFLPAILFVAVFGGYDAIPVPGLGTVDIGVFAYPLTVFWIVGMMNVYNFMDGVNGLAGSCGALCFIVIALVGVATGNGLVAYCAMLMAGALAGFLPGNLRRGDIFMGDGGSQPVGFLIAASGVLLAAGPLNAIETSHTISMLFVPLILLPFIVDVGFTLIARSLRGQNVLHAHREHVYQLLLRQGLQHGEVTAIYLAMVSVMASVGIAVLFLPVVWQVISVLLCIVTIAVFAAQVNRVANRKGLLTKRVMDVDLSGHEQAAE